MCYFVAYPSASRPAIASTAQTVFSGLAWVQSMILLFVVALCDAFVVVGLPVPPVIVVTLAVR